MVNRLIGSNCLYVSYKPPGATLLDALPAWPWYLLYTEAIGLVMFPLLYLPFAIHDRHKNAQVSQV